MMAGACGVAFSAPSRDHTLFQSLKVTGQMRTGASLAAHLTYQQYLPIDIDIRCELRQDKKLVKVIGQGTVSEDPGGSPKATPIPGSVSYNFTVDAPGDYHVTCYTPSDEDNTIVYGFTVHGAGIATQVPK
jgi:hypothetical protein